LSDTDGSVDEPSATPTQAGVTAVETAGPAAPSPAAEQEEEDVEEPTATSALKATDEPPSGEGGQAVSPLFIGGVGLLMVGLLVLFLSRYLG
jgi:hypothetical protein